MEAFQAAVDQLSFGKSACSFAKAQSRGWGKYGLLWDLHPQVSRSWWHMYCGVPFWQDLMVHASSKKSSELVSSTSVMYSFSACFRYLSHARGIFGEGTENMD